MPNWYLHDPARFTGKTKPAFVMLSGLFGPMVAATWISALDLQRYVQAAGIRTGAQLWEATRERPGGPKLFKSVSQANAVMQWLQVSKDPDAWAKMYRARSGLGQSGGGTLLRNQPSLIYAALKQLNIVNENDPAKQGTPLGDPNHVVWLGVDILETFLFWVDELDLKAMHHALVALNQSAPSIVDLIQETASGLLSPLGVFPLSGILFNALGQIAAYPFIAMVTYLNISERNFSGALETSAMFLLFIGPFVNMVIKQVDRMTTVNPATGLTPLAEILNFPKEIAEQAEHVKNAGTRIVDAVKSVFGMASASARDAVTAATQSQQVKGLLENSAIKNQLSSAVAGVTGAGRRRRRKL